MNRNRLRIRTCCLAATIMLAGSGSMAVNAAPAAGLSDELSTTISSVTKRIYRSRWNSYICKSCF